MANEISLDQEVSREEAAAYLHQFADELEGEDGIIFVAGDECRSIHPGKRLRFRIETETDSSWLGGDRTDSVVFEVGWDVEDEDGNEDQEERLSILAEPGRDRMVVEDRAREIREERLQDVPEEEERRQEGPTSGGD